MDINDHSSGGIDPDYAQFLEEYAAGLYDNYSDTDDHSIQPVPSDNHSEITSDSNTRCTDNIYYKTSAIMGIDGMRHESHVFEFGLDDLNCFTTTQIVSVANFRCLWYIVQF